MTLRQAVRAYLIETLAACGGKVDEAAKAAGVHRSTFYAHMKRADIPRRRYVQ